METSNYNSSHSIVRELDVEGIDLRSILLDILKYWYVFAISIPICMALSILYIKTKPNIYRLHTSILIGENQNNYLAEEGILEKQSPNTDEVNIENEIGILRSTSLIMETLKHLNHEFLFWEKDEFKLNGIHSSNIPFEILLDSSHYQLSNELIGIQFLKGNRVMVSVEKCKDCTLFKSESDESKKISLEKPVVITARINEFIETPFFRFAIQVKEEYLEDLNQFLDIEYKFQYRERRGVAKEYQEKLDISTMSENSSIINIALEGEVIAREKEFLDWHGRTYLEYKMGERNKTAIQTLNFIERQLANIGDSLNDTENQLVDFRRNEEAIDLGVQGNTLIQALNDFQKLEAELVIKKNYYEYLETYLTQNQEIDAIFTPSSSNVDDPMLGELIKDLKSLSNEKVSIAYTSKSNNPELEILDAKIQNAKDNLLENTRMSIFNTQSTLNNIQKQINELKKKIDRLPIQQKNLTQIERQFNVNDNIYRLLLEKKAELGIAIASSDSNSKIIDEASLASYGPVYPKKMLFYGLAFISGILLPLLVILIAKNFNSSIKNEDGVKDILAYPVIGTIPKLDISSSDLLYEYNAQFQYNLVGESFRELRTNLNVLSLKRGSKVLGITSSIGGEGKTFCSANLGIVFAVSKLKTIIIEADLHNPQISNRFNVENKFGLSEYLNSDFVSPFEIIQNTHISSLDIFPSGSPNIKAAEYFHTKHFHDLIELLKQSYDCVIIDSPPLGLISDYMSIASIVETHLCVVRKGFSNDKILKALNNKLHLVKIEPVYLILNEFDKEMHYYGNNYVKKYTKSKSKPENDKAKRSRYLKLFR